MADSTEHVEKEQLAKEPEEAEKPRQSSDRPRNRVQVSKDSHPLNFYVNLAEKLLHDEEEVELSGLGMAVSTTVTIAGILKNSGHVEVAKIETSLVGEKKPRGSKRYWKPKIQIWIKKTEKFVELIKAEESLEQNSDQAPSHGS
mmetsp:Transcript_41529/g.163409  ORF Transcript_41529/g.163409 Transcript_41529/m.163409 type:complete len:144 (-) Transcript_41529:52-483(-)